MSRKAACESPPSSDYASAISNDDVATAAPPATSAAPATAAPSISNGAPARHIEPLRVLTQFWKLPKELQQRIIIAACGPPTLFRSEVPGRTWDCTRTMNRLSQSGKELYALATPLLYANVRLTRPSALRQFQQTLASRPALGRLVKTLHIGPTEALPDNWWPIVRSWGIIEDEWRFRVNLIHHHNDPQQWGCRTHDLPLKICTREDWRWEKATSDALQAASCALDVDLHHDSRSYSGSDIGTDAWHVRVLEVQAAMELFCFEAQRYEEMEKERTGERYTFNLKVKYPRLVVDGGQSGRACSPAAEDDGKDAFHVTRTDIYRRMTRGGAPTDHFNHPLLFARSGLGWIAEGPGEVEHWGEAPREEPGHEGDPADFFAWPASTSGSGLSADVDLSDPVDLAIPSTASIGGNLSLARSVLSSTPLLRSLSLTGFLENAVIGERAPPPFEALKNLTIGPPPTGCSLPHRFDHQTFSSIEKLRICGHVPTPQDIATIVGDDAFPSLRELQWSVIDPVDDGEDESLMCVVEQLIGFDEENAPNLAEIQATGQRLKRNRTVYEDEHSASGPDESAEPPEKEVSSPPNKAQRKVLLIEATLHREDVDAIIDMAPTNKVAEAWAKGKAVPGQRHRLQLVRRGKPEECGVCTWRINEEMEDLFEEGRRFWEESAG